MTRIANHPQQIHMDGSTRQEKLYRESIQLLRDTCPEEGFYLATSFGKDSIVAHRLLDEAGAKYDAHTNVTGMDPPELYEFGEQYYPDVTRHMYKPIVLNGRTVPGSMWRLIEQHGIPPMRNMRYCCEALKEDGGAGRICVMGIRAAESNRRAIAWAPAAEYGKRHNRDTAKRLFDPDDIRNAVQSCQMRGKWSISPLYHWNDDDLWAFIQDRKLPYCKLYDQGFKRLGCIGCPMATGRLREAEFDRWPKYRAMYVRAFDKLIRAGRFTSKGFTSGEDIMQWWLLDRVQNKPIDGQEDFFGMLEAL